MSIFSWVRVLKCVFVSHYHWGRSNFKRLEP